MNFCLGYNDLKTELKSYLAKFAEQGKVSVVWYGGMVVWCVDNGMVWYWYGHCMVSVLSLYGHCMVCMVWYGMVWYVMVWYTMV